MKKSLVYLSKRAKTMRRIYKNPSYLSLVIFPSLILLLIWFEIGLGVDKEVIAISITGVTGFLGYFITHYLERERKKKEEKFSLYTSLMSSFQVMTTSSPDKTEAAKEFSEVYYTSYLYISTAVYELLKESMKLYHTWGKDKTDLKLKAFNEKTAELMQAMRDEITPDTKADFVSFDIKFKT